MPYRIEISAGGQAGCQAPQCKKEKLKIAKGEVRQGVLVTINEHSSMRWRHWGCVTPPVIHNWWEEAEQDFERIDGLDEVPEEVQEKVKRALLQGHIDDEEFNGDVECNRWNGKKTQSMFLTDKEKAALRGDDGGSKKPTGKKRGRPAKTQAADEGDDDEDNEPAKPAAKKARGKKAVDADEEDAAPAKKGRGRPKKAAPTNDDDEEAEAAPKKARGRPRKSLPADDGEVKEQEDEAEATVTPAKKARGRPRKSAPADADEEEPAQPSAKKGRGRPKKAQASSDGADVAPKRGRGRPRKSLPAEEEE